MAYHNNGIMVANVKELLDYWDFEKNSEIGIYPELKPVNSTKVVFWKCKKNHSWKEKIKTIYRRNNKCLCCIGTIVKPGENDLETLFPEIAAEWDYEKNKICSNQISPRDKNTYWWKCKNGHPSFTRSVNHRVERHDVCPYCSGRKIIPGINDLQTLYPKIASEWDYDVNNGVLPIDVSPDSWKQYGWICPKGHHYSMKVHLRTHSVKKIDCPKCVKAHSTSFPEQAIFYYTKQLYPDAINRYKGLAKSRLELDVYIPSRNIGIEYDGKKYHSSPKAIKHDKEKYEICRKKHIRLIRIKEDVELDLDNVLADEVHVIKKRPSDYEMNNFLEFFFLRLTLFTHSHFSVIYNKTTDKKDIVYGLPIDINIKRDRPKILEYLIDVENSFGNVYPDLAKNWDEKGNGELTPFMLSCGSNHSAFFKCERCGKQWSAPISVVVKWKKTMCKSCSMGDSGLRLSKNCANKNGSLADKYKELAEQWDYDANGELTPFDIPVHYSKKVFWKCPVCNYKWSQYTFLRINDSKVTECPHCSGKTIIPGVDDLETLYPELIEEWNYEKNQGILPSQINPRSTINRYWLCKKHNIVYISSPSKRVKGSGCKICNTEKIKEKTGFRIEQYSQKLEYIKTFVSINEAGRELNISPEAIRQAAINGAVSADSYWKYEGTVFGKLKPNKKHPVVGVNIKTGAIVEYESAREAERKTGIGHTKIMKCCKKIDGFDSAGGFYWHFKE